MHPNVPPPIGCVLWLLLLIALALAGLAYLPELQELNLQLHP